MKDRADMSKLIKAYQNKYIRARAEKSDMEQADQSRRS